MNMTCWKYDTKVMSFNPVELSRLAVGEGWRLLSSKLDMIFSLSPDSRRKRTYTMDESLQRQGKTLQEKSEGLILQRCHTMKSRSTREIKWT